MSIFISCGIDAIEDAEIKSEVNNTVEIASDEATFKAKILRIDGESTTVMLLTGDNILRPSDIHTDLTSIFLHGVASDNIYYGGMSDGDLVYERRINFDCSGMRILPRCFITILNIEHLFLEVKAFIG